MLDITQIGFDVLLDIDFVVVALKCIAMAKWVIAVGSRGLDLIKIAGFFLFYFYFFCYLSESIFASLSSGEPRRIFLYFFVCSIIRLNK